MFELFAKKNTKVNTSVLALVCSYIATASAYQFNDTFEPSTNSTIPAGNELSGGAIAGIVVGGAALVSLVAITICCIRDCRKNNSSCLLEFFCCLIGIAALCSCDKSQQNETIPLLMNK